MSAPLHDWSTQPEADLRETDRGRSSSPPRDSSPGRWWFAFDRWTPIAELPADEFVLA